MNETVEVIMQYAAQWSPAVTSIIGVIVMILTTVAEVKKLISEVRGDNVMTTVAKSNDKLRNDVKNDLDEVYKKMDALTTECSQLIKDNADLKAVNRQLTKQLRKVGTRDDHETI